MTTAAIPETMKAFITQENKTGAVVDVPVPTIDDDEMLIKVVAVALNPVDAAVETYGGSFLGLAYPIVWGVDGAGIVEAVGSGVTRFVKGDRV